VLLCVTPVVIVRCGWWVRSCAQQVLEGGGLEEADAWLVLRGILAGLAHIHSQVWPLQMHVPAVSALCVQLRLLALPCKAADGERGRHPLARRVPFTET
jgi:hypothetical protein